MEARSLVKGASQAVVKYQSRNITTSPLIHHARAIQSFSPSITYPLHLRRDLSNSPSSSSQAAAAAARPAEQNFNQSGTQQATLNPSHRRTRGTSGGGGKLEEVSDLLDNLGVQKSTYQRERPNRWSQQRAGNEVANLLREKQVQTRNWRESTEIAGALTRIARTEIAEAKAGPEIRLGPSVGRSIQVRRGDVRDALSRLNRRCAQNKVKADSVAQRFHVRKGKVKKNLKAARWRKLFKESFKATVERCGKLKRQGW